MVGRLDSRFTGDDLSRVRGEGMYYDPSIVGDSSAVYRDV